MKQKPSIGLSSAEAARLLKQYGPNEIVERKKLSALADFLLRFKNPLIIILLAAAIISSFFGEWQSSVIIIVIVIVSTFLDFFNTYRSHRAAEALKQKVMITAAVTRDGKLQEVPLHNLVPGDIVTLTPGDLVPADGEVINSKDFFLNESSLTGESFPVEKAPGMPLLMGSSVTTGDGFMLVTATGTQTKYSHIAESLVSRERVTEFDRSIKDFSYLIMKMTMLLVIIIFFINALLKHSLIESFLFAAALAVGLTPELLPVIISLNLSKGSLSMAKRGVIVKKLSAIQNFGSMDILCTDKTGTLTEDKISLVKYVDAKGKTDELVFKYAYISSWYRSAYHNPLDEAVKEFKSIDMSNHAKFDEIPFDYKRKRDSIIVESDGKRIMIAKGAAEELLEICTEYQGQQFTPEARQTAVQEFENFSKDGYRVLGVAVKELSGTETVYTKEHEANMTFVGFIAFLDPAKPTAREALQLLENYGIEIKILTGDNELVTRKITDDIHLPVKGVLLGHEIAEMTDQQLSAKVENTTVFARVNPEQKQRIIKALQNHDHVVGYLGDGINDAPSLKTADVSLSVNNAVDIAKESADLILLQKSLHVLIEGVIEGRKTFTNTLKYLMMALSSNFGNMFSMAGASLFLPFLPMLPAQILFNNLLYDSSQFTIPLDHVESADIQKPRKLHIGFVKRFMLIFGLVSSVFDFVTFGVLYYAFHLSNAGFQTGWFLESMATQTFVIYFIRTRKIPFIQSRPHILLFLSTFAAVVVAWVIPFTPLAHIFKFVPLSFFHLVIIALIVGAYLISVEFIKRWFFKYVVKSLS